MTSILIYGGSFDPPHWGHLNTLKNVAKQIPFQQILLMPCRTPVLKAATQATSEDRVAMLALLLKNHPQFSISRMEIDREAPSYTVDTLSSMRDLANPFDSITLLLGMDAAQSISLWHCAELLPTLCNLLVIERQGIDFHPSKTWIKQAGFEPCAQVKELLKSPNGKLAQIDGGQYPMSSTHIRHQIKNHQAVDAELPQDILDYIKYLGLYL
jgi:nicotinate-nucleotide adenylyltransferase